MQRWMRTGASSVAQIEACDELSGLVERGLLPLDVDGLRDALEERLMAGGGIIETALLRSLKMARVGRGELARRS